MFRFSSRILLIGILSISPLSFANDVLSRTKDMISAMKTIDAKADKTTLDTSFTKVDSFINFDQLSSDTILPHIKNFKTAEITTFKKDFKQLIRLIAYPDSGEFFTINEYDYAEPEIKGDKAEIHMEVLVKEEDLEMDIGFNWQKKGNTWLLTDMSIDEDSLVKDYQNQFGRLIDKEQVAGLLKKISDKLGELEK
jgi:ABC-type transporter MlaC component